MTERLKELAKIISDLQLEAAKRHDNESVLEIAVASRMLFRALPGAEEQRRAALGNMDDALSLLIPKGAPAERIDLSALKCSFCGRQEPEVMLGAGSDGFICDECVDLFAVMFRQKRAKKEQRNEPS